MLIPCWLSVIKHNAQWVVLTERLTLAAATLNILSCIHWHWSTSSTSELHQLLLTSACSASALQIAPRWSGERVVPHTMRIGAIQPFFGCTSVFETAWQQSTANQSLRFHVGCRCECGQPCNMATAGTVGPLHQAGPCSGVHPAAHAGHGTLQVPAGPPCCPGLPARDLLCGVGMLAQVSGGCTRWGLGGQACGRPLLFQARVCILYVSFWQAEPTQGAMQGLVGK